MVIDTNINFIMDPFYQLYCCSCHNYFVYCDCVWSYDDVIPEDGTSHESDGDDDDDDASYGSFISDYDLPDGPDGPEKRPPSPGAYRPPKKPKPDNSDSKPPAVLVDKPKPMAGSDPTSNNDDFIDVADQTDADFQKWQEEQKKKPPKKKKQPVKYQNPKKPKDVPATDSDLAIRYFNHGVPYPFLTSPSINYVMDTLKCPVYTGPQDPDNPEWEKFLDESLRPWFDTLPKADQKRYLSACFTADPKDGMETGPTNYYWVSVSYDHKATDGAGSSHPYVYTVTPIVDGKRDPSQSVVVFSDIRLPPRAFNNEESFNKYFSPSKPGETEHFIPNYKIPVSFGEKIQNRSGERHYRFYQSSSTAADPNVYIPITDPGQNDPGVVFKPHPSTLNVKFFANAYGNTDTLNGVGYKDVETQSLKFEPLFNAGYVNMSFWKTTADRGTPLGYPAGNVPNLTGMSGLISATGLRGSSSAYGVIAKGIASNSPVHAYGFNVPMGLKAGFRFPCEMVNRYSSGETMYACVWVKTKVIDWIPNNSLHYNMRVELVTNPVTYYYPAVYAAPIKVTSNGFPRIAIEQMTLLRPEGSSADINVTGLSLNQDFYFCCLVGVPDNNPMLDVSRGGLPFIEVSLGGKATASSTATSSDFKFEIVEISSLWKDNSSWGEFDFTPTFDGTGGKQALFPDDFTGDTSTPAYFNRQLSYQTWFETSPQIRALTGVFKDYNLASRVLTGENRLSNDSSNHWRSRKIFWPLATYTSISNLNKFIAGCSLDGSDTANVGAGYVQCKVSFFKNPTNWLPMVPGGTVPAFP